MPHFAPRLGHLFHVGPFGTGNPVNPEFVKGSTPAPIAADGESSGSNPDDPLYLGFCEEVPHEDSAAEMEWLSLSQHEGESPWELAESGDAIL
jgi:hypothetical protein